MARRQKYGQSIPPSGGTPRAAWWKAAMGIDFGGGSGGGGAEPEGNLEYLGYEVIDGVSLLSAVDPLGSNLFNPSVIYKNGRTYFVWRKNHNTSDGQPIIGQYYNGVVTYHELTAGELYTTTDDYHNNPTLAIDSDGYIFIIHEQHGKTPNVYKSTNPYNITAWTKWEESEGSIVVGEDAHDYPHTQCMEDGTFVQFCRNGGTDIGYSIAVRTSSDAQTWSSLLQLTVSEEENGADSFSEHRHYPMIPVNFYAGNGQFRLAIFKWINVGTAKYIRLWKLNASIVDSEFIISNEGDTFSKNVSLDGVVTEDELNTYFIGEYYEANDNASSVQFVKDKFYVRSLVDDDDLLYFDENIVPKIILNDDFGGNTIDTDRWPEELTTGGANSQNEQLIQTTIQISSQQVRLYSAMQSRSKMWQQIDFVSSTSASPQYFVMEYGGVTLSISKAVTTGFLAVAVPANAYTFTSSVDGNGKSAGILMDGNSVSFWYWDGDEWIQLGTTQTIVGSNSKRSMILSVSTTSGVRTHIYDNFFQATDKPATRYPAFCQTITPPILLRPDIAPIGDNVHFIQENDGYRINRTEDFITVIPGDEVYQPVLPIANPKAPINSNDIPRGQDFVILHPTYKNGDLDSIDSEESNDIIVYKFRRT